MVAPLLATSAAGHWLAWPWKRSGGGAGWWLRSLRRSRSHRPRAAPAAPPPANPLPQSYAPAPAHPRTAPGLRHRPQITALAHWFRHQPSPASPLAARAFALARPIGLPPAPVNAASCFGMPCASPFGAPLGAPAPGWLPRSLPAKRPIVGCRPGRTRPWISVIPRMPY